MSDLDQELKRARILKAKARPCKDCSIEYPYYVMDFDHRLGSVKRFSLSDGQRHSFKEIETELNKCDVVCSNCHRARTHQRQLDSKVALNP